MLSSTVSSSLFYLYVDNRLDDRIHRGVDDHFLEYPCAREQKRDNGPEHGQLFFVGQGSASFIGAVIRFLDILYNGFLESPVYYRFSAREAFPGC